VLPGCAPDNRGMSIAARFQAALQDVSAPGQDRPELLPVRLAVACSRVLRVDGAGISLARADGERIPLGASSQVAARAERLQFTVGEGPCMTAQAAREPVFAVLDDLHRRWSPFADLLVRETPYRAVVALPLPEVIAGLGAIDLYFQREDDVLRLDVFEAMAVGDLVSTELSDAAVWSTWSTEEGPAWLHGPDATGRARVWEAIGVLSLALDSDAPPALELLRTTARETGRTVDEVAADLLSGRLDPAGLRTRERTRQD
jgi:hypothetical protein